MGMTTRRRGFSLNSFLRRLPEVYFPSRLGRDMGLLRQELIPELVSCFTAFEILKSGLL